MARTLSRRRVASRDVEEADYADEYEDDSPPWDEDEDEKPRRSRERERPARRSRRDEDEAPRRSSRRDSDDERPARKSSRSRSNGRSEREERPNPSRGKGWDAYKDQRAKRGGGKDRLSIKDNEVIIKFLESEPFAIYEQHWVGQRSYTCPGDKCPLCERGYDTRDLTLFNVVDMKTGANLYWEAGPNAAGILKKHSEGKYAPLNRADIYWAVERLKKSNGFYEFTVTLVKERDLEDYDLDPLSPEETEEALEAVFDEQVIPFSSVRDLKNVADEDDD